MIETRIGHAAVVDGSVRHALISVIRPTNNRGGCAVGYWRRRTAPVLQTTAHGARLNSAAAAGTNLDRAPRDQIECWQTQSADAGASLDCAPTLFSDLVRGQAHLAPAGYAIQIGI